jgi:hypothetical protein
MDANKYVNLGAVIPVECVFNQKHKKWMPVRLAGKTERLIHIEKLVHNVFESKQGRVEYGKRPQPHQRHFPNNHRKGESGNR